MKTRISQTRLVVAAGAILSLSFSLAANTNQTSGQTEAAVAIVETGGQTATTAPATGTTVARDTAAVKLPYGVDDVLKLSHAQVSEDVTLNYIQNSGTIYGLSAKDIVYLKNEGVSDRVINAMQDQRKRAMESVAQSAPVAAPAVQVYSGDTVAASAPTYVQAPIYVQEPLYFEPVATYEPEYAPASSLYVIPYPTPTYPRYTFASSYPRQPYFGAYAVFGGPGHFGPASYGPAFHGGHAGAYHFGGGGRGSALGGGHGGHSHSGAGHHR